MTKLEDVINEIENMVTNGNTIKDSLWVILGKYELTEKTTEMACKNDNLYYLQKFIMTKRMEGLSETTLEQYTRENKSVSGDNPAWQSSSTSHTIGNDTGRF